MLENNDKSGCIFLIIPLIFSSITKTEKEFLSPHLRFTYIFRPVNLVAHPVIPTEGPASRTSSRREYP